MHNIYFLPFERTTGKLFCINQPTPQPIQSLSQSTSNDTDDNAESNEFAEPEAEFLLNKFHENNLLAMDERLKKLWLSVGCRHFQFQIEQQTMQN